MKFDSINQMDPDDFERLVGMCFSELGFSVYMTRKTKDGGVDVVIECHVQDINDWIRYVVQVKRYKNPASVNHVRELNGILPLWKADRGILICLGGFTGPAKEEAGKLEICLEGKKDFKEKLKQASLLSPDDNILDVTDPNLENNRKRSIIDCLFINKPKILSMQEIILLMRRNYNITVSDIILIEDLKKLSNQGHIIKMDSGFHYRITPTDIRKVRELIISECVKWDHFFNIDEVTSVCCSEFSIATEIGNTYLIGEIERTLFPFWRRDTFFH